MKNEFYFPNLSKNCLKILLKNSSQSYIFCLLSILLKIIIVFFFASNINQAYSVTNLKSKRAKSPHIWSSIPVSVQEFPVDNHSKKIQIESEIQEQESKFHYETIITGHFFSENGFDDSKNSSPEVALLSEVDGIWSGTVIKNKKMYILNFDLEERAYYLDWINPNFSFNLKNDIPKKKIIKSDISKLNHISQQDDKYKEGGYSFGAPTEEELYIEVMYTVEGYMEATGDRSETSTGFSKFKAMIQNSIAMTQFLFNQSGVDRKIHLFGEPKKVDLSNQINDQLFSIIKDMPSSANLKMLITSNQSPYGSDLAGAADSIGGNVSAVVGSYIKTFVFPHEIGHNLGAQHDMERAGPNGGLGESYAHGFNYVHPTDHRLDFRTIMSQGCPNNFCSPFIPFFSNPNTFFIFDDSVISYDNDGVYIGSYSTEDNVGVMNNKQRSAPFHAAYLWRIQENNGVSQRKLVLEGWICEIENFNPPKFSIFSMEDPFDKDTGVLLEGLYFTNKPNPISLDKKCKSNGQNYGFQIELSDQIWLDHQNKVVQLQAQSEKWNNPFVRNFFGFTYARIPEFIPLTQTAKGILDKISLDQSSWKINFIGWACTPNVIGSSEVQFEIQEINGSVTFLGSGRTTEESIYSNSECNTPGGKNMFVIQVPVSDWMSSKKGFSVLASVRDKITNQWVRIWNKQIFPEIPTETIPIISNATGILDSMIVDPIDSTQFLLNGWACTPGVNLPTGIHIWVLTNNELSDWIAFGETAFSSEYSNKVCLTPGNHVFQIKVPRSKFANMQGKKVSGVFQDFNTKEWRYLWSSITVPTH